jgi:hypothetical protein
VEAVGLQDMDSPVEYGDRSRQERGPSSEFIRSPVWIDPVLKGHGYCVARSLTAALIVQTGWAVSESTQFLEFAMRGLGPHATHDELCKFIRRKPFTAFVRRLPVGNARGSILNVEIRKKTKHWTEVMTKSTVHKIAFPPIAARTILPKHIRRAQTESCPQLLVPVDRHGCTNHMYMLAPTGDNRRLVVWDPSSNVDQGGFVPWFTSWNCVQLDICCVKNSYPLVVVFLKDAKKLQKTSGSKRKR